MANHLAVKLDRLKVAEMSCIAGLGGDVKPLVQTAKSGRPIIAMDGCPLHCAAKILARHGLRADKHLDLSELGVKKRKHEDFDPEEAARVLQWILDDPEFPGHARPAAAAPARERTTVSAFAHPLRPPTRRSRSRPARRAIYRNSATWEEHGHEQTRRRLS